MLVDDDEDSRFLLSAMLRKRGFIVDTVDSAAACLQHLASKPVAVVVTDVEMPGMSGIDLCKVLRARYPEIAAIVMSGLATAGTSERALESGAFTFLPKPVSASTLAQAIHQADLHS
jgi:DNA-binding NtrC family response regulator